MVDKIREIAARIRELRELSGIAVPEIASAIHLSPEEYLVYEQGEEDIPASVLFELAHILKVDMGVLLTGEEPHMHVFTVTRCDHGVGVKRCHQYSYQSLAANFIHKKAEPFLVTVEPKPAGTELSRNSHPGQEFDYVIEGKLRVHIHHNSLELAEGDSVFFDSGYEHAMEAVGDKPARFLAVIL